jgi:hypothetical protein
LNSIVFIFRLTIFYYLKFSVAEHFQCASVVALYFCIGKKEDQKFTQSQLAEVDDSADGGIKYF